MVLSECWGLPLSVIMVAVVRDEYTFPDVVLGTSRPLPAKKKNEQAISKGLLESIRVSGAYSACFHACVAPEFLRQLVCVCVCVCVCVKYSAQDQYNRPCTCMVSVLQK